VDRLARALGAVLSDDAGRYVCNAWLHRVASALDVPVGFVHVPAEGIAAERLLDGISALIDE
jgi:pyrrolidone-carboxylate peptidase